VAQVVTLGRAGERGDEPRTVEEQRKSMEETMETASLSAISTANSSIDEIRRMFEQVLHRPLVDETI
jgi:hypothetical protein